MLAATASSAPAPGGGGIAAMTAASATALLEMVANLTIGKAGYEAVAEEMEEIRRKCLPIHENCLAGIDADAQAFRSVIAAVRIPKDTPGRTEKVQQAFKDAAQAPFELSRQIFTILQLSQEVVRIGNKWVITDAAIAALNARAAMRSAFYSVKVNLRSITDEQFVQTMEKAMADLDDRAEFIEQKVMQLYEER